MFCISKLMGAGNSFIIAKRANKACTPSLRFGRWDPWRSCAGMGDARSGLLPRPIVAIFKQFSGFEFILLPSIVHARLVVEVVVEPVETLSRHTCHASRTQTVRRRKRGVNSLRPRIQRQEFKNAKTKTWKQQSGSLGSWTRLHENDLWR
jgi:hypothetical protein